MLTTGYWTDRAWHQARRGRDVGRHRRSDARARPCCRPFEASGRTATCCHELSWLAMKTDILVVGAGFSGSVVAERLASHGFDVLVVDKRPHIGGNAYDVQD